jgi:hypothetical protein
LRNARANVSKEREIEQGQDQLNGHSTGQANGGSSKWATLIEDQGMTTGIAYPTRTGVGDGPHEGFDLAEGGGKGAIGFTQQVFDPGSGPADEVGPEQGKLFLELHAHGRAHQMTLQSENAFAFLDTGLNDLTAIVTPEPLGQRWGRGVVVVEESGIALFARQVSRAGRKCTTDVETA